MEEIKQTPPRVEKPSFVESNTGLIAFLVMEVLFFLAFGIINADNIMRIIGIVLALVSLPLVLPLITHPEFKKTAIPAIGLLVIYGVFSAIAPIVSFNNLLTTASLTLAFAAFFLLGMSFAQTPQFKVEHALIAILGGISLLVVISALATFYAYGFFHIARLSERVIYFEGEFYLVANQIKWLYGFEIREASVNILNFNGGLLLSLIWPLALYLPTAKKINKYLLIAFGGAALVGILALIFLPYVRMLLYAVPALIFAVIYRFYPKNDRILKTVFYTGLGIFGFLVFIGLLYAFEVGFVVAIVDAIPLVNRVFGSGVVAPWLITIKEMFVYPWGSVRSLGMLSNRRFSYTTENFLLDTLRHAGIMAFLALAIFLFFAIKAVLTYAKSERDTPLIRGIILVFLVTFFVNSAINYPFHQLVDVNATQEDIFPFARAGLWLISLFLLGYVFLGRLPKEEPVIKEEVIPHE